MEHFSILNLIEFKRSFYSDYSRFGKCSPEISWS